MKLKWRFCWRPYFIWNLSSKTYPLSRKIVEKRVRYELARKAPNDSDEDEMHNGSKRYENEAFIYGLKPIRAVKQCIQHIWALCNSSLKRVIWKGTISRYCNSKNWKGWEPLKLSLAPDHLSVIIWEFHLNVHRTLKDSVKGNGHIDSYVLRVHMGPHGIIWDVMTVTQKKRTL